VIGSVVILSMAFFGFVLNLKPVYETDRIFSLDRQYSVYTSYQDKRLYEHLIPILPGGGSAYHNCKTIIFDERENKILMSDYIFFEEGVYARSSDISFADDSVKIRDRTFKLPRPIRRQ
jgi:hypothetical protein